MSGGATNTFPAVECNRHDDMCKQIGHLSDFATNAISRLSRIKTEINNHTKQLDKLSSTMDEMKTEESNMQGSLLVTQAVVNNLTQNIAQLSITVGEVTKQMTDIKITMAKYAGAVAAILWVAEKILTRLAS